MADDMTQAQQDFIGRLNSKVSSFLGTQLDGPFSLVNYPPGYAYLVQFGPNNYWNEYTLNLVDQLAALQGNGLMSLTGQRLSTLYSQILQAVVFKFSSADNETIETASQKYGAQQSAVISTFENDFGTVTATEASSALPPTKIGYITGYVAKNFNGSAKNIPFTASDFRNAWQTWQNIAADFINLSTQGMQANAELQAALANATGPVATNGGLQTSASSFDVAYNGFPATTVIVGDLQNSNNAVSIACSLSNFNSTESNLSIEGGASFTIPLDFMSISFGGSASYSLYQYSGSASQIDMSLEYPGITIIRTDPLALSADQTTGWYDTNILSQVVAKTGKDVTGFQLQGSQFNVASLFGQGKQFARVKTFVISQQPTISLIFQNADVQTVKSNFKEGASLSLKLFGLFGIGSASESYQVQKVSDANSAGEVTVTLGPSVPSGSVPDNQKTAYVLGGVVAYPPA
jgi:hypothetical protein